MPTISFSGLASGIDSDAIIKAMTDAKRLAATPLENKVEINKQETTALEEFNTKLLTLSDSVKDFLTLAGGSLSKTVRSSNSDAITATASSGAALLTSTITVEQLARPATVSFDDRFSSNTDPIAPTLSGPTDLTFTIGQGSNLKTITVAVDETTTLSDLAEKLNQEGAGLLQASVINVGTETTPSYTLYLGGLASGEDAGLLSVQPSSELATAGLFQSYSLQQAQNSVFTVSGVGQITRQTNQVSDILPGISLDLKQVTNAPVSLSVNYNAEKTAEKVRALVEAMNEVIKYSRDNSTIERVDGESGPKNQYGTLARTRIDEQAVQSVKEAISNPIVRDDAKVRVLADLGITTQRDGTLGFDEKIFTEALGKDPAAANEILSNAADKLGSASGVISGFTKYQGQIDIALSSNEKENESVQDRLDRIEQSIARQTESLRLLFANLESTIGRLNSQSSAISQILAA